MSGAIRATKMPYLHALARTSTYNTALMGQQTVNRAGERLILDGAGGLYWPRRRTLFIADPHFGKDDYFRHAGLAVPAGTLDDDLVRLDDLLVRTGAERLVILGDVVHAGPSPGATWPQRIASWRARHATLDWLAVAGNHDAAFRPPTAWRLDWHSGAIDDPPFALRHEPTAVTGRYTLAGHWHPVTRLRAAGETTRLAVFAVGDDYAVLPAFGSFTGGAEVTDPSLSRFALAGDRVVALPG